MANFQAAALNKASDGLAGDVTHFSLHTADGGSSGDNEISGGDYARETVTYSSASGGTAALSGPVTFDGPGTLTQVTHLGYWDGSTWLLSSELDPPREIGPDDTLTITAAPITISAGS